MTATHRLAADVLRSVFKARVSPPNPAVQPGDREGRLRGRGRTRSRGRGGHHGRRVFGNDGERMNRKG